MIQLPLEVDPAIRRVAYKIGLALYYKHKGRSAPHNQIMCAYWAQSADRYSREKFEKIIDDLPNLHWGKRQNIEFGQRFGCRWNSEAEGDPDIFMSVCNFGSGMLICNMLVDGELRSEFESDRDWITVKEFSSNAFPAEKEQIGWAGAKAAR